MENAERTRLRPDNSSLYIFSSASPAPVFNFSAVPLEPAANAVIPSAAAAITVEGNPNVVPQTSFTDTIEILIYTICLCIGGPLNLISFRKLSSNFICGGGAAKSAATKSANVGAAHITLLKLNLNIADLLTMFVYTLSQIIWMISYQWYAGDFLCRVCKFFHTFGFYLNSFVVACFALDRAFTTYNLKMLNSSQAAIRRVKRMLSVAWLSAFLLSLPQSFIFRVVEPPGMSNFKQCTPIWTILGYEIDLEMSTLIAANRLTESRKVELVDRFKRVVLWERAYNVGHLLFVFWIPTLIIVWSYMTILCVLNSFSVPKSIKTKMGTQKLSRLSNSSLCSRALNGNVTLEDTGNDHNPMTAPELRRNSENFTNKDSPFMEKSRNNECARKNGVETPRNSLTSALSTIDENEPDQNQKLNSNSKFGAKFSKYFSLKYGNGIAGGDMDRNLVATSMSSPLSIRYVKESENTIEAVNRYRTSTNGHCNNGVRRTKKLSSDSCLVRFPLLNIGKSDQNIVSKMALKRIAKARQKTKRQAALILMAYLTIWTPYNLLAILNAFSPNEGVLKEITSVTLPFLNSMIVMNPIVNPLIYGLYEK